MCPFFSNQFSARMLVADGDMSQFLSISFPNTQHIYFSLFLILSFSTHIQTNKNKQTKRVLVEGRGMVELAQNIIFVSFLSIIVTGEGVGPWLENYGFWDATDDSGRYHILCIFTGFWGRDGSRWRWDSHDNRSSHEPLWACVEIKISKSEDLDVRSLNFKKPHLMPIHKVLHTSMQV